MIDLYQWTTPKGHKSTIALAEFGVECRNVVVNILAGEQFRPGFLRMSPNNRIPAIVDHDLPAVRGLLSVFESGAVLEYLADKTGQLLATAIRVRLETLRWLSWQVVGLGPTKGEHHHFAHYAPERIAYATECDLNETGRLYRVLDERLWDSDYIAEAYSIPTSRAIRGLGCALRQSQHLEDFRLVRRAVRPAGRRRRVPERGHYQRGSDRGEARLRHCCRRSPACDPARRLLRAAREGSSVFPDVPRSALRDDPRSPSGAPTSLSGRAEAPAARRRQ